MNCFSCELLHPSGFCPAFRATVPEEDRTNQHDCPRFKLADPAEIAMRLSSPLRSGEDGLKMRDLWDAADYLAGRTQRPPRRITDAPGELGDMVRAALASKMGGGYTLAGGLADAALRSTHSS